jgi:hypothetical protein
MTHERDIDRLLDQWFLDGPTEVADRVIREVADQIDRQAQRPAWRLLRRPIAMTSSIRWAAVFAALALIAVVGFVVFGRPSNADVGASPTPTTGPSHAADDAVDSSFWAQVEGRWIGETRLVPGITGVQEYSALDLQSIILTMPYGVPAQISNVMSYDTGAGAVLRAEVSDWGPGVVTFTSLEPTVGCQEGDAGRYRWSLSPGQMFLTLTADRDDPCAARAVALPGTWTRVDCTEGFCLGDLEAGTYRTTTFKPFGTPPHLDPAWQFDVGEMTFAVPKGWMNTRDSPEFYDLSRQADWTAGTGDGIFLDSVAAIASQAADCPSTPEPGIERTVQAVSDWLTSHQGLIASDPQLGTIGGYPSVAIDLSMAPTWTKTCPDNEGVPRKMVHLFTYRPADGNDRNLVPAERMRVYLVDLGDGRLLLIDIVAHDDATFQALLPEATAIVESIDFHPPAP